MANSENPETKEKITKNGKKDAAIPEKAEIKTKRTRTVRNFPASSFAEPLAFAKEVLDYGSGQPVRRVSLFDHIGKSSESGASRQLITNANKYGLIKGSYQAEILELTPEGKKASDEQIQPRERTRARIDLAVMGMMKHHPRIPLAILYPTQKMQVVGQS